MQYLMPLALVFVFLIVSVCTLIALARAPILSPGARALAAICSAALAVLALCRWFARPQVAITAVRRSPLVEFVLLPYGVLALALVFLLLVLLTARMIGLLGRSAGNSKEGDDRASAKRIP